MARRLRDHLVPLPLVPEELELRDGLSEPVRRPSAAAVVWTLLDGGPSQANPQRRSFADDRGNWHRGKATVARDARGYVRDEDAAGPRVIRTATLVAEGVRTWRRIDFLEAVPEGCDVGYRLWDGTSEWAWTGAAWVAQVSDATGWTHPDTINANLATFPATARRLGVVARLSTDTREASPAFFGVRVALSCVERGDEEDALIRGVLASLRAAVTVPAFLELDLPAAVSPSAPLQLFPESPIDVRAVDAVFDRTTDPNELTPIAGALTAWTEGTPGTPARWTPTSATIPAGRRLRLEASIAPDVVVQRHRDLAPVARLPAVRIYPGTALERYENDGGDLIYPREAPGGGGAPIGLDVSGAIREVISVDVLILAELGADARRIAGALGDWLGRSGYRRVVSRETGRISTIQARTAFVSDDASLAEGVTEIQATWRAEYETRRGRQFQEVPLVKPGGVGLQIDGG